MPRKYELKRRAEQMEETRRRITEAAVDLHGTVGPARTTISAVAERAGVERLTVYRHFPDEHALFQACTGHWLAENPPPDPARWATIEDPEERLGAALSELYAYYRGTEQMLDNFLRDAPDVPALASRLSEWEAFMGAAREVLFAGRGTRGRRRSLVRATLGHALELHTWASLAHQGLSDRDVAELMVRLTRAAEGSRAPNT